jgi:hypothetical protein
MKQDKELDLLCVALFLKIYEENIFKKIYLDLKINETRLRLRYRSVFNVLNYSSFVLFFNAFYKYIYLKKILNS